MKSAIRNPQSEMGKSEIGTPQSEIVRILLIEDSDMEAQRIQKMLAEVNGTEFTVERVDRLSAGLERLANGGIDIVLLDLVLPDSEGLETFFKAHAQAPEVPIVVLTSLDDETITLGALRAGAQDYLVKGDLDATLLGRSIRYAIERQRLIEELERTRQREQRDAEFRSLEELSGPPPTSVTAETFGLVPMRRGRPKTFQELVQSYGSLLDLALEQRAYRIQNNVSEGLRSIAEEMGSLKAGPRDVVEIHSTALKLKVSGENPKKVQAYAEEGRLIVIELMGHLASHYRNYALGPGRPRSPEARNSEGNDKNLPEGGKHE